jgi:uracil-DNA glycosylase
MRVSTSSLDCPPSVRVEISMVSAFVKELASARIGGTHNQYADSALRRRRLVEYLESRAGARLLLVGEAAGYRGARVSGLAFTSERQLTGTGPAEISATIVHRTLEELGIADDVLLWNLVPTHPHRVGDPASNRVPTRDEVTGGRRFVDALAGAGPSNRLLLAVGRLAQRELGAPYVRHPSHGGAAEFRATLAAWMDAAPR